MIIPCIDLMDGKVVQLIQGKEKALEGGTPAEMLDRFAGFPEIQVIDLDAAIGRGENDEIVAFLAASAVTRVGGGVRTVDRARKLMTQGARKVIVGTAAFAEDGVNTRFLETLVTAVGRESLIVALDSKNGHIVVKGWRESTSFTAEDVIGRLEPYCSGFLCTYVDKEGMLQGTDLGWYARLRRATKLELTAAGGITTMEEIRELQRLRVHAALGMAIYTGRLSLEDLARVATAAALMWLSGCVPSLQPLYTDKERTTESDLLGTWSQADNKDVWEFESGSDESYILTYTEKGVPAKFRANLVQLGDHLFLDLYPAEEADLKNDLLKLHLLPAHTFARLRIKGDSLELTMMDNDWLRGKLARKELAIPHEALEDGVVLTASTKQLQDFVMKYAVDPQAFPKPTVLKRND